ncbi:MAG TPA: hypothetical protein VFQ92_24620 [Blastocatellia bacterium]|nr:hypothetical protein [Blastocatellia bacterium]
MMIPREGSNTPVESIGTWASHADEDVLRPTPNKEGVEPGGNDLASMQSYKKFWADEQDSYILVHTIEESAAALGRSTQSIKMRLWRLHSSNK